MLREFFNELFFSPSSKTFFVIGDNELSKYWQVSNTLFLCSENRPYICYLYIMRTYDRNNIKYNLHVLVLWYVDTIFFLDKAGFMNF